MTTLTKASSDRDLEEGVVFATHTAHLEAHGRTGAAAIAVADDRVVGHCLSMETNDGAYTSV